MAVAHRSLSRRDRQGSQLIRALLPLWRESIEEGPAGFPTAQHRPRTCAGVYRGGTGRVPNLRAGDVDLERSLSRRDRQGSQRTEHAGTALGESIEEGPAGFPTEVPRWRLLTGVYRGGTGRVPNPFGVVSRFRRSRSRRDRQGSQQSLAQARNEWESIEEGPAGFPTSARKGGASSGVYRGGTGRVPNSTRRLARCCGSLSRRDRQGSQRFWAAAPSTPESIEEGPAGFPTPCARVAASWGVYRGGTGRVPNKSTAIPRREWSLSRRDRQGSQQAAAWWAENLESIEEGPAGFLTRAPAA